MTESSVAPACEPESTGDPGPSITSGLANHPGHLARRLHQMTYVVWSQVVSERVTPPQFVVLHVLADHPMSDQTMLSERSHFDQSTIADVTRRLVTRGYVRRERDPEDRRRNLLSLTEEGSRVLDDLRLRTDQMNNILLTTLSPAERKAFQQLSERVIESIERLIPRAPRRGRLRTFARESAATDQERHDGTI